MTKIRKVLIADDDGVLLSVLHALLSVAGYEVKSCANGAEALRHSATEMPDLMLLDLEMPFIDGYEVCRQIRARDDGRTVPILVLTGNDAAEDIDRAYAAGATDFLPKPINWTLLLHRVKYIIRAGENLRALNISETRNRVLMREMPDSIFSLDSQGMIADCFAGANGLPGDLPRDTKPEYFDRLVPAPFRSLVADAIQGVVNTRQATTFDCARLVAGVAQHLEFRFLPYENEHILALIRDVSTRKQAEQRMHALAYFDTLTGLPNREWLYERLGQTVSEGAGSSTPISVIFVNMDRFRRVGASLGQFASDAVLVEAAERLRNTVAQLEATTSQSLPLAKFGMDEFVIWMPGSATSELILEAAEALRNSFAEKFQCNTIDFELTASLGIAEYPSHGTDVVSLLRNADAAANKSKALGRNRVSIYHPSMNNKELDRVELESDLRKAILEGQLTVEYQPKYDVDDLGMIGSEALLRWRHPVRGNVSPGLFIPLAEECGMIRDLDRYVIGKVAEDLATWRRVGLSVLPVAINLSATEFLNADTVEALLRATSENSLPASLFELEITETALITNPEVAKATMRQLRQAGFRLALDDFGTGYSSLTYLRDFPVDMLKIDRSFVAGAPECSDACSLIRAVIQFAHALQLKVVAEGVETADQLELLRREQCDVLQGHLFNPALPATVFSQLLPS
jgi:diguanylate cyclase (GGDEF)-like protein